MKYAAYSYEKKPNPEVVINFNEVDINNLPSSWFEADILVNVIGIKVIGQVVKLSPNPTSSTARLTLIERKQGVVFKGTVIGVSVPLTGSIDVTYKIVDDVLSFTVADTRDPTPRKMVIRKPNKVTYTVEDLKKACKVCTLIADALSVQLIVDQSNKFSIKL